ncbi:MAG TPA: hypothetical protein VJ476_00775 [Rhizomicrobium sp.]|nr:hypothetical protein [Rhizomicrobium sp.]
MAEEPIDKTPETPAPSVHAVPHYDDIPDGTEDLLDAQLAEALKIVRDFSAWIHLPTADIENCMAVSGRVCALMTASAQVAKSAARARLAVPPRPDSGRS